MTNLKSLVNISIYDMAIRAERNADFRCVGGTLTAQKKFPYPKTRQRTKPQNEEPNTVNANATTSFAPRVAHE